jgi:hypothetical protein
LSALRPANARAGVVLRSGCRKLRRDPGLRRTHRGNERLVPKPRNGRQRHNGSGRRLRKRQGQQAKSSNLSKPFHLSCDPLSASCVPLVLCLRSSGERVTFPLRADISMKFAFFRDTEGLLFRFSWSAWTATIAESILLCWARSAAIIFLTLALRPRNSSSCIPKSREIWAVVCANEDHR